MRCAPTPLRTSRIAACSARIRDPPDGRADPREGKTLSRTAASRADLMQAIADADDRLEPGADEPVTRYAEVLATVPAAPAARPAAVAAVPRAPAAR